MHAERLEHFLIRVFERPYSLREKEGRTTSQSYQFGDGDADFGQSKRSLPNLKAWERSNREGGNPHPSIDLGTLHAVPDLFGCR